MEETKTNKSKLLDKIKISEDGAIVNWTETTLIEKYKDGDLVDEERHKAKHTFESDQLAHKDLVDALKMLRKPVIEICELGDYKHFDKYRITGVNFSGEQGNAKVIIFAGKEIEWSGQVLNFNTPLTPLYDNEKYAGAAKLDELCANVIKEAWLYIDGKCAENPQLSLEFEDGSKENISTQ